MAPKNVGYVYDPLFLEHTLARHPERAERLSSIMNLLRERGVLQSWRAMPAIVATDEQLCRVHTRDYVREVSMISGEGGGSLGPDTYLNDASFDVAALAAGSAHALAKAVIAHEIERGVLLARPPGHHAFADHGEGFCLFNSVAFAAHAAFDAGLERVLIVDFDVHHGNGTQALFYTDPRVLYISAHQMPLYPGTGSVEQTGQGAGRGTTINVPLPPGAGDHAFDRFFTEVVAPAAARYQPQMLLISAGFDAHWRDPLAQLGVSLTGFAQISQRLCALGDALCGGRILAVLEGGYDFAALSHGVLNLLAALAGEQIDTSDALGPALHKETDTTAVFAAVKKTHGL